MKEFISYCRFITFDGDIDDLVDASKRALDKASDDAEGTDDDNLSEYAHKTFLEPHGLQNEILTWKFILNQTNEALKKFPTSL